MPNWSIKTNENVNGQIVTRNYDVVSLDFAGALNRSWHLDGVAVEITNKDAPNQKYNVAPRSWSSGSINQVIEAQPSGG